MNEKQKRKHDRQWGEVEEYRSLLEAPNTFEDGFTTRTMLGVLFISLIMTPGEMYLGLVTGGGIGAAAQWVTVILFLEVAKRSFTSLRRQEIYLLVYIASALVVREEGAFLDLLWKQYFVRSAEAEQFGITRLLPWWWAPPPDSEAIAQRTFLHRDWAMPIFLLIMGTIMGRIGWFTSGYVLFRLTSDRERLPFPTAPMSALSAMALAEESGNEAETWKWPVFSIGAMIGAVFGAIYVGIPTVTGIMGTRVELIPIPFADLTPYLGNVLHATPLGVTLHLGPIFAGLLMPFWAVIGSFSGVMVHTFASPVLHELGYLPRWELGMDTIRTQIVTGIDFWRAFGIGITLAVTFISFYQLFASSRQHREEHDAHQRAVKADRAVESHTCQHGSCTLPAQVRGLCLKHLGRGDFKLWVCILLFSVPTLYSIILAKTLFPTLVSTGLLLTFVVIGFVYAPIMSVVSARLDGMVGREVSIPYVHEAIIFLTGFRGVDIWFVPFPGQNFGGNAEQFRIVELTGMRFTSLLKAEIFMLPIIFGISLMYWTFLWRLAPIPSDSYPYAQLMWPLRAFDQALFLSSTMYNKTWLPGETVDGQEVLHHQTVWSPSNLQDHKWWYWRVRVTNEVNIPDPLKRDYGEWSQTGIFYTDFEATGIPPANPPVDPSIYQTDAVEYSANLPRPQLVWPSTEATVHTANPNFRALVDWPAATQDDSLEFYFEVDRLPSFDGEFLQRSSDRPLLFEVLWKDLRFTGDHKDNDNDRRVDIMVSQVNAGGLGQSAGIEIGDRIHAINGQSIQIQEWETIRGEPHLNEPKVQSQLAAMVDKGGDSLRVSYKRGKRLFHKKVFFNAGEELFGKYTLTTPLPFMGDPEVIIGEVPTTGLWPRLGLKKGDLLQQINGAHIRTDGAKRDELDAFVTNEINSWRDSLYIEYERDGEIITKKVAAARGGGLEVSLVAGQISGIDEELHNLIDDDGDGRIDEDTYHPLDGKKWPIILFGAGFGLVAYFTLAFLGMPIFLIWGYVQSVNGIPHSLLPQIIGALLARFYFWKRYGKQQWRRYAMVLSVGFGVGMSLVGMFCAALAMISKAVSSLMY